MIGCACSSSFTVSTETMISPAVFKHVLWGTRSSLNLRSLFYFVRASYRQPNRPNPIPDVHPLSSPTMYNGPKYSGPSKVLPLQPGISVAGNWKQRDVKRGCSPEARPAVARWLPGQPTIKAFGLPVGHSLRGARSECWHDGRPDSPRPSPRCWLRSQMTPTRGTRARCVETPGGRVPFISRLSPSERIPLDWNPRTKTSGIDSRIPPRRDIDCICPCRDCCATKINAAKGWLSMSQSQRHT